MRVRIYAEGGGEGERADQQFREGWGKFFEAAGLKGRMPSTVRGRGRNQTFDLFRTAVENPRAGLIPLLLVDSEEPVRSDHSAWQHLAERDGWEKLNEGMDEQVFLMVEVMETWFLADREMLSSYFGSKFKLQHLKEWPDLERVSKAKVYAALDKATSDCKKSYSKGKVSFELLARLDPKKVESQCSHAKALLDRLRTI